DPYEAIRQAYLVEIETPESPHTVASPTPLPDSIPPTRYDEDSVDSDMSGARSTPLDSTAHFHQITRLPIIAEVAAMSDLGFHKRFRSSYESSPLLSPPDLPLRNSYRGT
ncbi:hypothetical protein Tco_1177546, partial [Tanacetum coccineum]